MTLNVNASVDPAATSHNVIYSIDGATPETKVVSIFPTSLNAPLSSTVTVQVSSNGPGGTSALSAPVTYTPPQPPSTPTNVTITA